MKIAIVTGASSGMGRECAIQMGDRFSKIEEIWLILLRKEAFIMAVVYATLIVKGKKTFADVPDKIKPQVKDTLEALDCGELAQ